MAKVLTTFAMKNESATGEKNGHGGDYDVYAKPCPSRNPSPGVRFPEHAFLESRFPESVYQNPLPIIRFYPSAAFRESASRNPFPGIRNPKRKNN